MYNYLANLIVDKDLPELSPLEACILWDTISEVYGSSAVQSNPECVNHLRRQFEALTSTTGEVYNLVILSLIKFLNFFI